MSHEVPIDRIDEKNRRSQRFPVRTTFIYYLVMYLVVHRNNNNNNNSSHDSNWYSSIQLKMANRERVGEKQFILFFFCCWVRFRVSLLSRVCLCFFCRLDGLRTSFFLFLVRRQWNGSVRERERRRGGEAEGKRKRKREWESERNLETIRIQDSNRGNRRCVNAITVFLMLTLVFFLSPLSSNRKRGRELVTPWCTGGTRNKSGWMGFKKGGGLA